MGSIPTSSGGSSLQIPGIASAQDNDFGIDNLSMGDQGPVYSGRRGLDPRTSSSQSLAPLNGEEDERQLDNKRKLLFIYIHGFMGNDSSFQSFLISLW